MDGTEYRAELLKHATKRGYTENNVSGNDWTFSNAKGNARAVVQYEPGSTEKAGYLIWAKGELTSHSLIAPPPRPRYSLKHPKRANPSQNRMDDWLWAEPKGNPVPKGGDNDNVGKWLIFCAPDKVDDDWRTIKLAVEAGLLPFGAKVSTFYNGLEHVDPRDILSGAWDGPDHYVICVYTPDWHDREDVFRYRTALSDIGYRQTLYYKTDTMTRQGERGHRYKG